MKGSASLPGGTLWDSRRSRIGDVQLGAVLGLIGSPALPATEYAGSQPGFALDKVFMPTVADDASARSERA